MSVKVNWRAIAENRSRSIEDALIECVDVRKTWKARIEVAQLVGPGRANKADPGLLEIARKLEQPVVTQDLGIRVEEADTLLRDLRCRFRVGADVEALVSVKMAACFSGRTARPPARSVPLGRPFEDHIQIEIAGRGGMAVKRCNEAADGVFPAELGPRAR